MGEKPEVLTAYARRAACMASDPFTLSAGVAMRVASPLKFPADMGVLLSFVFMLNMLGAPVGLRPPASRLRRAPA